MLKIAICDDSEYMRNETEKLLLKYSMQKDVDFKITQFERGEDLLDNLGEYNIVFLDYEFEDKGDNGMVIAREIRKINRDITIVFLSSYTNIVFETFEVGAFRFLVKPIDEAKLFKTMDDFMDDLCNDKVLSVKADGTNYFIRESQISYVEGAGKNCIIHYIDKPEELKCGETLAAIEERLSKECFFRCHKSFLINMNYVDSFSHTDLVLTNGANIMISRNKYKPFTVAYADYISKFN